MNVFKQLDFIFSDAKAFVDELDDHFKSGFEHYNAKSTQINELVAIRDDLQSQLCTSKKLLDNCALQSSLEPAIKNYAFFLSENGDIFKDKITEDDMKVLLSFSQIIETEKSVGFKESNIPSNDLSLCEVHETLSKEVAHVSTLFANEKTLESLPSADDYISNGNNLEMKFIESKASNKLSIEEINKLLQECPFKNFPTNFPSESPSSEFMGNSKYESPSPVRLTNNKDYDRDIMTHSILKSSSRFVSNKQQNTISRVKFILNESMDTESSSPEVSVSLKSKIPTKSGKENTLNILY